MHFVLDLLAYLFLYSLQIHMIGVSIRYNSLVYNASIIDCELHGDAIVAKKVDWTV